MSSTALGAAESLRTVIGAQSEQGGPFWMALPPVKRATYERSGTAARVQLGKEACAAAWAQGRTMPLEQALAAQEPTTMPQEVPSVAQPTTAAKRTPIYPAGLTARQVEVLRLVAQGLSAAQVAEQLVISRRTLNWHLSSIDSKLGVSSRCAVTRSAMEHQLVERFLSLWPPLTCSRLRSSCASSRSREPHPVILPGCLRLSGCLTIQRQVMQQVILQMCHRPHPATL